MLLILDFFLFFLAKLAFKSENLFHFRICKFKEVEVLTFITQALSSLNFTITSESFCIQKKNTPLYFVGPVNV